MSFKAPKPQFSSRTPVPAGLHQAICFAVVDIGTQSFAFKGKAQEKRCIRIGWQIPSIRRQFVNNSGTLMDVASSIWSQKITLSMFKKSKLRPLIENWIGKPFKTDEDAWNFEFDSLCGVHAQCQVQVGHEEADSGEVYERVMNVLPPAKGQLEKREGDSIQFHIENLEAIPRDLPPFIDKNIRESAEFREFARSGGGISLGDAPF